MGLSEWVDPFPCQDEEGKMSGLQMGRDSTLNSYKAKCLKLPP